MFLWWWFKLTIGVTDVGGADERDASDIRFVASSMARAAASMARASRSASVRRWSWVEAVTPFSSSPEEQQPLLSFKSTAP